MTELDQKELGWNIAGTLRATDSPPSTHICYQLVKELTGFQPAHYETIVHYRGPKAKWVPNFFRCFFQAVLAKM